jgi:hypothetical protein
MPRFGLGQEKSLIYLRAQLEPQLNVAGRGRERLKALGKDC